MDIDKTDSCIEFKHSLESLIAVKDINDWPKAEGRRLLKHALAALEPVEELSFTLTVLENNWSMFQGLHSLRKKKNFIKYSWKASAGEAVCMESYLATEDGLKLKEEKTLNLRFFFGMLKYALTKKHHPHFYFDDSSAFGEDGVRLAGAEECPELQTPFMDLIRRLEGVE